MWLVFNRNLAALLALFIFVLGNGFFSTLISSILTQRHALPLTIGLMTTCFYAGLVIGSFYIERLIARVSHIRTYAAFASILTVIALLHGVFDNTVLWLLFRFIGGIATAGVFIVVESWLLTQSTLTTRGQVLSLYMITFYASQSLGQLLLGFYDNNILLMFVIIAISSSLSVIPVSITRAEAPKYNELSTLGFKSLFLQCASSLFGCFIAGLVMGVIYALFPVFLIHQFSDPNLVARLMFTVIFGGMLLQYPIGRISDVIERRLVLIITSLASIVTLFLMSASTQSPLFFTLFCALFGGLTFTLYPVSISYACDALKTEDIVAGTQTLLLTYSIGAMTGPLIAPIFMNFISSKGLLYYFITILAVLCIFLSWRKAIKVATPHEEEFVAFPQNSPITSEVDPRGEPAIDTSISNN